MTSKGFGPTPRGTAATGSSTAARWDGSGDGRSAALATLRSGFSNPLSVRPQVFISNGWLADLVVVVAVTDPEAKSAAHGISLFLVEDGMKGFIKGRKLEKMGLKAQVLELSGGLT